jgi:hypothetical protein
MDHNSKFMRAAPHILRRIFQQVPNNSAAKLFAAVYNEVKRESPSSKHCYRITITRFFAELGLVVDPKWDLKEIGAASKYGSFLSDDALSFAYLTQLTSCCLSSLFCSHGRYLA